MSASPRSDGARSEGRERQREALLGEVARTLASGRERSLVEAIQLIGTLPDILHAALEIFPEREGAAGLLIGYPPLDGQPPLRAGAGDVSAPGLLHLERYASRRYEIADGVRVIGTLALTFDSAELPRPEVVEWYGMVADLVRGAVARYHLEALLLNTQRFEVAGQIAAGLVHDFNNLLTGIVGYSAIARARMTPDHPAADALRLIDEVAATAGEIAHLLVDFVRGLDDGNSRVDPNEVVRHTRQVTARAIRDAVAVEIDLAANVPEIEGTPMLIQQALVNLVVNAADAISGEGEITIRTRLMAQLPAALLLRPEPADRYVAIAVADTGEGVSPELQERIFEPFFTTKGRRGSGLGLTAVIRVVQRHGGGMHLASRVGHGSTFTIFLPVRASVPTGLRPAGAEAARYP